MMLDMAWLEQEIKDLEDVNVKNSTGEIHVKDIKFTINLGGHGKVGRKKGAGG